MSDSRRSATGGSRSHLLDELGPALEAGVQPLFDSASPSGWDGGKNLPTPTEINPIVATNANAYTIIQERRAIDHTLGIHALPELARCPIELASLASIDSVRFNPLTD